jgi:hypothetical protein
VVSDELLFFIRRLQWHEDPLNHTLQLSVRAGLLHWFVGPYVHKLWHNAPARQVKVEMRNVFVQKRYAIVSIVESLELSGLKMHSSNRHPCLFHPSCKGLFLSDIWFLYSAIHCCMQCCCWKPMLKSGSFRSILLAEWSKAYYRFL